MSVISKPTLSENIVEKMENKVSGKKIYVLMGASGSGKTTVANYLKKFGIPEIISHTTRSIREGEVEGETYYYVTKEEFDLIDKIEQVQYDSKFYCISKMEIENKFKQSDKLYVICDVNGMEQVKKNYPNQVVVIYLYTTLEEMERRMRVRGDAEENIQNRLDYANQTNELENGRFADYLIENKVLEDTKREVMDIVLQ
jgi:guanylate kinase